MGRIETRESGYSGQNDLSVEGRIGDGGRRWVIAPMSQDGG